MKVKFLRKFVTHKYGTSLISSIEGNQSYKILWEYLDSEVGYLESCSQHLESIRKIRSGEITDWGDGGNCCASSVKKDGVIIEHDYIYLPENNILNLSLDQFEKAIIGWKTFLEDESLMECEVDI